MAAVGWLWFDGPMGRHKLDVSSEDVHRTSHLRVVEAARRLGVSERTLVRRRRELGLTNSIHRAPDPSRIGKRWDGANWV